MSTLNFADSTGTPAAGFPNSSWRSTRPTERIAAIKQRLLNEPRSLDVERARYTTQAYRASEGRPMALRRAHMLLHLVRKLDLTIQPGELIAGNRSLLPRMGVIAPEGAVAWIDQELDILATRPQDRFNTTPQAIRELRDEIFPYWRGRTLEDTVAQRVPEDVRVAVRGRAFSLNQTDHAQGHILPDVTTWLRLGISGLRTQVQDARRQAAVQDDAHQIFYDAALVALQAAQEFALRYAALALEMAEQCHDTVRQRELRQISANCRWLAEHPAHTFQQALQAVWFLFVLLQIWRRAS
jgi:formate C-acetyltransferase